ncbi:YwqG family protein [Brevibacillus sp. 179-C 1.1 NHS]|uniref:YwqG family protein n=1 Tax=Brevibacillus sp. 179-C 1.1 NHS TaxID=3235177 RepID=UPI0039A28854
MFVHEQWSEEWKRLRTLISENELDEYQEKIIRLARESVVLATTEPDDYSTIGNTRMGGVPDWPSHLAYPSEDGLLYNFLCQINCSDLKEVNRLLPDHGMLYFFIGDSETASDVDVRVVYYDGPSSALQKYDLDNASFIDEYDIYTDAPFRVQLAKTISLPYAGSDEVEELFSDDDDLTDQYSDVHLDPSWPDGHGLLVSYPYAIGDDPRLHQRDDGDEVEDWVCLLELGDDQNTGFCFWDAGFLQFLIRIEDVKRRDFSNVRGVIQTS